MHVHFFKTLFFKKIPPALFLFLKPLQIFLFLGQRIKENLAKTVTSFSAQCFENRCDVHRVSQPNSEAKFILVFMVWGRRQAEFFDIDRHAMGWN
jgi:hypothetical protein